MHAVHVLLATEQSLGEGVFLLAPPRATIDKDPFGSGRCSDFGSARAVSQVSHSPGWARTSGVTLGWIAATSAFGAEVRKPKRSARDLPLLDFPRRGPARQDAGEESERATLVKGGPDRRPPAIRLRSFWAKLVKGIRQRSPVPSQGCQCRGHLSYVRYARVGGLADDLGGVGIPQRAITSSRRSGIADDRRAVIRIDAGQRRHLQARSINPSKVGASPLATSASNTSCTRARSTLRRARTADMAIDESEARCRQQVRASGTPRRRPAPPLPCGNTRLCWVRPAPAPWTA